MRRHGRLKEKGMVGCGLGWDVFVGGGRKESDPDCGGLECWVTSTFSEPSGWAGKESPIMSPHACSTPVTALNVDRSTLGQRSGQGLPGISAIQCRTRHSQNLG